MNAAAAQAGRLYFTWWACWDMCPNVGRDVVHDPNHHCYEVHSWPITRWTSRRVYFRPDHRGREAFLDREDLEANGSAWHEGLREHLHLEPPALPDDNRQAPSPDLSVLKQQMAAAHPDRGGSDDEFIAARARYQQARGGMR